MKLTNEQHNIINSTGNIKINAIAGSGKTTTIIEYAKARPRTCKILYLAFNKSVKQEAIKKFHDNNLFNVNVETAHSLAYRHIVRANGYKLKTNGYKTHEIVDLLNIRTFKERHTEYIIAKHINKLTQCFCNSQKRTIQELNYAETLSDPKAKTFVKSFNHYIIDNARVLMTMMDKGEIDITHDFYLKKFQLSNPTLDYDYILFDEGQDASMAMLDVFLKQGATKVIVGDTHQQIYNWRYAVNSLEKAKFKTYNLSTSFRFCQDIANLAVEVLKMKKHIDIPTDVSINGVGNSSSIKRKAVLARTNLGLLIKAIEYVTEKQKVQKLYFEGNINSYTYATEGASLYDVLNLFNGKHYLIRDQLIKKMNNLDDLIDYIEKAEDRDLAMMVDIVKEYGNEIPNIIQMIRAKHVDNRDEAEMIFSTVHRSKGMEYDVVQIVNDFLSEEHLIKLKEKNRTGVINQTELNEEINLLYVAVTRTRNSVYIPETLIPKSFPASSRIRIMKGFNKKEYVKDLNSSINITVGDKLEKGLPKIQKTKTFDEIRLKYEHAYKPWSPFLDAELTVMFNEGVTQNDMAKHFGRTRGAVRSRVKKLGLKTN
ncbi:MAG TPA: UvrD-helicase domain-containing protein [Dysgonamonadaceae bacterium]|jgi:superfamily I DNA/RNA helicase|nr:UvrD-helicase domain-containing protein [Dysgonamonadaceae bacterium]